MSDFMEVFAVTHLTYLFIFPCIIALLGIVLIALSEVASLDGGNIFLYIFVFVFSLIVVGTCFKKINKAPYWDSRMIQFSNDPGTKKLKTLDY